MAEETTTPAAAAPIDEELESAEEELVLSRRAEFSEATRQRMEQVGSEYLQFAHSRRWGIGNINTLQKYIHHLFVQKRLAPTTVSSIFSLLRSFVARPPHNTHWTQDELKSIYDYLNIKLKHHQKKQAFVLSQENIETYCKTAPNSGIHLRHKLVLIIGMARPGIVLPIAGGADESTRFLCSLRVLRRGFCAQTLHIAAHLSPKARDPTRRTKRERGVLDFSPFSRNSKNNARRYRTQLPSL